MKKIFGIVLATFAIFGLMIVLFSGGRDKVNNSSAAGIVLVQKAYNAGSNAASMAATFTSPVQSGNLLVVSISSWPATPSASPIKDSLGNTFSAAGPLEKTSGGGYSQIFYAKNIIGGTDTVTFSVSSSGSALSIAAAEFSGLDSNAPLDTTKGAIGGSNSPSTGSFTPTASGDLLIGAGTHDAVVTTTAGTGFTMIADATEGASGQQPLAMEYQILSGSAATSTSFKLSSSTSWAQNGALFKIATGPADTTPPTVSIAAPTSGSNVSGTVSVSANASDNVAVASVQFQIDGTNFGNAISTAPYQISWDTTKISNGSHTLTAIAKDTSNNSTTSAPISVNVTNAPIISGVNVSNLATTSATINWTTNVATNSQVNYGLTSSYGSTTNLDSALVTSHSENISGLTASTTYHYQVVSSDSNGVTAASTDFTFSTLAAPDTTPPTVSIAAPTSGSNVSGTISVSANASDNVAVASVQFQIDGTNLGSAVTTAPYTIQWDTTTVQNGAHTLTAIAKDTSNNSATSNPVSVTVANPPTISAVNATAISSTAATITWSTNISANSQVNYGLTSSYGSTTNLDSALVTSHSENISGLTASTTYHYQVVFSDSNGVTAASTDFTFSTLAAPDTTPPTVSIAAPTSGSNVSGTISVSANASDNVAVASVQFQIDGTNLGSAVTTAPYTIQWDTTTVQNGAHTLTAIAKDTSNNSATSNPVSVTVANPPTISAVNATAISSTAATITWSTNISANSQVNYGLTSSYGSTTNLDSALVTSHSENISGLTASTTYHYQVLSTESVGDQVASTDFTFTTAAAPDTTPPTVSLSAPSAGSTVAGSTVMISANASDNVAVANVQFQIDGTNFGSAISTAPYQISWDTTKISNGSHSITAVATDTSNNSATSNPVSVTVANPPTISNVSATAITKTSATITWTTNVATNSQVNYGLTSSYGSSTNVDSALVTSHSENISGLTASTTYHYQVVSADGSGLSASSNDFTFTTQSNAPAAIKLVQQASGVLATGSKITATLPTAVQAGDTLVVSIASWPNPPLATSVTDSLGNTYVDATPIKSTSSSAFSTIYYAKNVKPGTDTATFSLSTNTNSMTIIVAEFSGADPNNPLDAAISSTGSSKTPASGNMTPSMAGDVAIGSGTHDATTVTTVATGFTMVANATENASVD